MENKELKDCGELILGEWHLEKRVTITQIITLVTVIVSGIWWASNVDARIIGLGAEDRRIEEKTDIIVEALGENFRIYQKENLRALGRIDRSIGKLGDKIDNKADK